MSAKPVLRRQKNFSVMDDSNLDLFDSKLEKKLEFYIERDEKELHQIEKIFDVIKSFVDDGCFGKGFELNKLRLRKIVLNTRLLAINDGIKECNKRKSGDFVEVRDVKKRRV